VARGGHVPATLPSKEGKNSQAVVRQNRLDREKILRIFPYLGEGRDLEHRGWLPGRKDKESIPVVR